MKSILLFVCLFVGCCMVNDAKAECVGGVCLASGMPTMTIDVPSPIEVASCQVNQRIESHVTMQSCSYAAVHRQRVRSFQPVRRVFGVFRCR